MIKNPISEAFDKLSSIDQGQMLLDFLKEKQLSLYGISLDPRNLVKLRREIQRRYNINPEELQK